MNIAQIKHLDIANGPGVRVSVFVSGCTRMCKGCFNAVAWDFDYGYQYTAAVEADIMTKLSHPDVRGLSILGGEPFETKNQPGVKTLVNAAATLFPEKDIWMFTGYTLEELLHSGVETPYVTDILKHVAVLVDGPFILEKKNLMLKYRGSENQRLIDVPKTLEAGKVIFWKDKYDRL